MNRGKGVTRTLHKAWLPLLAVLLTVLAMPAFALGLGQLTVKSQRGEPLLAEIAIVSNDPGELENLQVRLASWRRRGSDRRSRRLSPRVTRTRVIRPLHRMWRSA